MEQNVTVCHFLCLSTSIIVLVPLLRIQINKYETTIPFVNISQPAEIKELLHMVQSMAGISRFERKNKQCPDFKRYQIP